MFKLKLFSILSTALLTVGMLSAAVVPTHANAQLQGGDFMQAFNNSTQQGTWRDPVDANPGDVIEFRLHIQNNGDTVAKGVQAWGSVTGQVPQDPANQLVITGKVNDPDAAASMTDTATINVLGGTPVGLRYYPGHARINGVTNIYNCPNSCDISDNGVLGGLEIGDIQPGDFAELTFKASLIAVNPTPTPTPTVSPTPTPSANTNQTIKCPDGHDVTVTAGQNANVNTLCQQQQQNQNQTSNNTNTNNNTSNSNNTNNNSATGGSSSSSSSSSSTSNPSITITVPAQTTQVLGTHTVAVSNVKELPKTGLPLAAWLGGAFIPAGLKFRKAGKSKDQTNETASYIWENREFNKS